jgi:hypothetical protein
MPASSRLFAPSLLVANAMNASAARGISVRRAWELEHNTEVFCASGKAIC